MDAASEVKARLNIEDVVSQYVQLKRTGRNFKGLSPWTNERTPSFIVSPEKQIWHDFSSGRPEIYKPLPVSGYSGGG